MDGFFVRCGWRGVPSVHDTRCRDTAQGRRTGRGWRASQPAAWRGIDSSGDAACCDDGVAGLEGGDNRHDLLAQEEDRLNRVGIRHVEGDILRSYLRVAL